MLSVEGLVVIISLAFFHVGDLMLVCSCLFDFKLLVTIV